MGGYILNDYNFGNFVCELREKKGLTQADIAGELNVTPAAVSKWENGSSKPRVEVLFRLAEILGVRPEELMAGKYLEEESPSPEALKQLNDRYEYLRRIDSYNKVGVKFRRIGAAMIDWLLSGYIPMLLSVIVSVLFFSENNSKTMPFIFASMIILSFPVLFILRDIVWKGRSLGKRIFGLVVLDRQTGEKAKVSQRFIRGIFMLLLYIDALILLVTGRSIGDMAANTVVVLKKDIEIIRKEVSSGVNIDDINKYGSIVYKKNKENKKTIIAVVAAIALFIGIVYAAARIALKVEKDSEEYKIAYTYLIESEEFEKLGVSEKKIDFIQYNSGTYNDENGVERTDATLGFKIEGEIYYVVCHRINGEWNICEECTDFE